MNRASQRHSRRVRFPGGSGHALAGVIDAPRASPRGVIVLTHCFTCNKDYRAIVRICRALAERGVAVLRYDLSGLGDSDGNFSDCTFADHVDDCLAAAAFARAELGQLDVLCGYSLGGAASMAAAVKAELDCGIATIGAPADTTHLAELLLRMNPQVGSTGEGAVTIGGREWLIRKPLVDSLQSFDLARQIAHLAGPVLLFHSPEDETVDFTHARRLLEQLWKRPSSRGVSLVSLDGADHLLTRQPGDWDLVASTLAAWTIRYAEG